MFWNFVFVFLISLFISSVINYVFLFNQTAIILICSIFLLVGVCLCFFVIELEFLAIAFSTVYIGGIAVMFLFLILVVDANAENIVGRRVIRFTLVPSLVCAFLTLFFSVFCFNFFDPVLFNSYEFYESVYYSIWNQNGATVNDMFNTNVPLYDLVDVWVLGVFFFKFYSFFLILAAIHLFVAMIVSLIFCANVFEKHIII